MVGDGAGIEDSRDISVRPTCSVSGHGVLVGEGWDSSRKITETFINVNF